jgi:hypothetical protein
MKEAFSETAENGPPASSRHLRDQFGGSRGDHVAYQM